MKEKFAAKTKRTIRRIAEAWKCSTPGTYGAAVAYSTIFSLAPVLIIVLFFSGLVFDSSSIKDMIISNFSNVFGEKAGNLIAELVSTSSLTGSNVFLTILSIVLIILSASAVFSSLQKGLDKIYENQPEKKLGGFLGKILKKLLSVGMVLSAGFILMLSLIVSAALEILYDRFEIFDSEKLLTVIIEVILSYVVISLFISLMLKFLPSKRIPWRPALMGGLIAGAFFELGKLGLGKYLATSKAALAYGSASALVLIVLWTYYMAVAFFFSAILTKLYFLRKKD
ncbi:MAG TPA: YihY/virulence factor BrkB family protein [Candidatus Paceibacterota bacterium]|nr:YihY/virulence factor BrkB family protein [Candidatus Paceibacterota bacterium]